MQDGAPTLAVWASATAFVGSHPQMQSSISYFKLVTSHKNLFQTEQGYDKLSDKVHGFLLFQRKCNVLENRKGTYDLLLS